MTPNFKFLTRIIRLHPTSCLTALLAIIICLFANQTNAQYLDDTSFTGIWLRAPKIGETNPTFKRTSALRSTTEGFQLSMDGKIMRIKIGDDKQQMQCPGKWWSLNLNHFGMEYFDSSMQKLVIERFTYPDPDNKNFIQLWDTEARLRLVDTDFPGFWKIAKSDPGSTVVYSPCDTLEHNTSCFYLSTEGKLIRQIPATPGSDRFIEITGSWWCEDNTYFDMQYYNPERNLIIIEGFQMVESGGEKRLQRTRNDEIRQ